MLFYCRNTAGNLNIRQTQLVSLPLSVHFPPLFLAPPPSNATPHRFLLPDPTQVILYLSHNGFQLPLSFFCTKWFGLVSGPKSLPVIHPARVSGQPACLSAPRVTTHESQESGNHVGPDVLPRFSQLVMPTHRSLVSAASAWPLFQRHYDMLAEALNNSQSSL